MADEKDTDWKVVGWVPIYRAIDKNGNDPLFLKMHAGDGTCDGHKFDLGTNVGGGDLILRIDGLGTYVVSTRPFIERVFAVIGGNETKRTFDEWWQLCNDIHFDAEADTPEESGPTMNLDQYLEMLREGIVETEEVP